MTSDAPPTLPDADHRAAATTLIGTTIKAATAFGRPDLVERLEGVRSRLASDGLTVVVVGEFKAGKSSLVNAIVGADVCPVDVDEATAVPTVVEFSARPGAAVIRSTAGTPVIHDIDPATITEIICTPDPSLVGVRLGLDRELLAEGITLIDTPGVGGLDSRRIVESLGVLAQADVVLYAVDAAAELGGPGLDLLRQIDGLVPSTYLVLTKTDLAPQLAKIRDADRHHLAAAGLDIDVFCSSAELARWGRIQGDRSVELDSGVVDLVSSLRDGRQTVGVRAASVAASTVIDVVAQLRSVFETERSALLGVPEAPRRPVAGGPGWQQLLADDIADLTADLDFDLRRRARDLAHEVDSTLAEGDVDELWPEVVVWLEQRAAADVIANFTLLRDRTAATVAKVAARFDAEAGGQVDTSVIDDLARNLLASMPAQVELGEDSSGRVGSSLNAFRSTFYAFSMFSSVAALVGLAVATPAALVLGVAVGGKSIRDERQRGRAQRRAQAKAAVRTYLDELTFVGAKDSREALRSVQRSIRDHFSALAAAQARSVAEGAAAAAGAAERDDADRRRRVADIDAELARLARVEAAADQLLAGLGVGRVDDGTR